MLDADDLIDDETRQEIEAWLARINESEAA